MSAAAELAPKTPESHPVYELAAEKYFICSRLAIDSHNANLHVLGELYYHSLYDSGYMNGYSDPKFSENFPERHQIFTANIPEPAERPEKEKFIDTVKRAITNEADSAACLYPGTIEQMSELMLRGSVVIWTAGDTLGTAEAPGSMAQYAKLAKTGLARVRTEVARETGRNRLDTMSVISAEDKLSDGIIDRLEVLTEGRPTYVMDDRLKNLAGLQARLPHVIAIWVQQDKYGMRIPPEMAGTGMSELQRRYNAVRSFAQVGQKVSELSGPDNGESVFLVDFDGTLVDSTKLAGLQQQAVLGSLSRNGWI